MECLSTKNLRIKTIDATETIDEVIMVSMNDLFETAGLMDRFDCFDCFDCFDEATVVSNTDDYNSPCLYKG